MPQRSIYKSDEGREKMRGWYEHFCQKLEQMGHPLTHREVSTRHGATNVVIGGPPDAPPLWCFHGAMASAPAALMHLPALLEDYRVHFPDTVGQPGRSAERLLDWQGEGHGEWVIDVLDAFGADQVTALGASLGGYVVLRAAQRAPERIARAVLWTPGGLIKPSMRQMGGLIFDGLRYALSPSPAKLERVLSRTLTENDDEYTAFFADSLAHVHPDRRFPALVPAEALKRWQAPVFLVTHELDTVFPAQALERRAREVLPGLEEVRCLEGFRHMAPFNPARTDEIMKEIKRFVTK